MDIGKLFIFHSKQGELPPQIQSLGLRWKTCIRDIVIGEGTPKVTSPSRQFDFYTERAAYQFLLKVACGLDSPVIGETEVFGQFKKLVADLEAQGSSYNPLKKILREAQVDIKRVRTEFLINLGAQTYGSLLRKKIGPDQTVHIFGSGQFTKDLLPWIAKFSNSVHVYARNPERVQSQPIFSEVNLKSYDALESQKATGSLIVACPMVAERLFDITYRQNFSQVFDLRGESKVDPLVLPQKSVESLESFFDQINNNKESIHNKVKGALDKICHLTETKANGQKLMPFGWDDVCA